VTERVLPALLLAGLLALPLGCSSGREAAPRADRTVTYLAHLAADVYRPEGRVVPQRPVVVLVPGGGWLTADPAGLRPLAARLAAAGFPAVTITYRAADDGVRLPKAVDDIRCGAAFAAHAIGQPGRRPVVLAGHSSGAHLAAVAALAPRDPSPACEYPAADIVGFIGLAGPYDLSSLAGAAEPLLGASPAEDPAAWQAADPLLLGRRPPALLRVLLVHGSDDPVVPARSTTLMATVLRAAKADVTVAMAPGADHDSVYSAKVAAPLLLRWLKEAEGAGAA
jgi:acetyl esterase/lipase